MNSLPFVSLGRSFVLACLGIVVGTGLAGTALAQETFQGRVAMKISSGSGQQSLDYYVKGDQMRVVPKDPRAQGGIMIMDMAEKKIFTLLPAQKMYMEMPLPELQTSASEDKKPEPTGETRSILGHTAQQYRFEQGGAEYEIWATDELGAFGGLHLPGGNQPGTPSPANQALANEKFFPLLIIERRNGEETNRVEVTKVEAKELDESLFEIPSDYQGMQMPLQAPR